VLPGVALKLGQSVSKNGQRFATHFEPQHVSHRTGLDRIRGSTTNAVPRNQSLDLSRRSPYRSFEPLQLGGWDSHPSQLAHRRPTQLAFA
jgi:hypothetical protein